MIFHDPDGPHSYTDVGDMWPCDCKRRGVRMIRSGSVHDGTFRARFDLADSGAHALECELWRDNPVRHLGVVIAASRDALAS